MIQNSVLALTGSPRHMRAQKSCAGPSSRALLLQTTNANHDSSEAIVSYVQALYARCARRTRIHNRRTITVFVDAIDVSLSWQNSGGCLLSTRWKGLVCLCAQASMEFRLWTGRSVSWHAASASTLARMAYLPTAIAGAHCTRVHMCAQGTTHCPVQKLTGTLYASVRGLRAPVLISGACMLMRLVDCAQPHLHRSDSVCMMQQLPGTERSVIAEEVRGTSVGLHLFEAVLDILLWCKLLVNDDASQACWYAFARRRKSGWNVRT
jgi:hypothetical protein